MDRTGRSAGDLIQASPRRGPADRPAPPPMNCGAYELHGRLLIRARTLRLEAVRAEAALTATTILLVVLAGAVGFLSAAYL
jgi:hypothetical protein